MGSNTSKLKVSYNDTTTTIYEVDPSYNNILFKMNNASYFLYPDIIHKIFTLGNRIKLNYDSDEGEFIKMLNNRIDTDIITKSNSKSYDHEIYIYE